MAKDKYEVASGEYNETTDTNAGPDAVSGTIANAPVEENDKAGGKSDSDDSSGS